MSAFERSNVGTVDALIRLTAGLTLMGIAASRRRLGAGTAALLVVGAWKTAEGVVRWDPLWESLGIDTRDELTLRANPYGGYPTYEEEMETFAGGAAHE